MTGECHICVKMQTKKIFSPKWTPAYYFSYERLQLLITGSVRMGHIFLHIADTLFNGNADGMVYYPTVLSL